MELESAIKHCEEVAEAKEYIANKLLDQKSYKIVREDYLKCAKEHRQLAEWLRELKAYRECRSLQWWMRQCDTCKHGHKKSNELPCRRCCHNFSNKWEYDETREQTTEGEVKADDE